MLNTNAFPDLFLFIVQTRLHEENERCLLYLDGSTRKPLVVTAEKQLLSRHTAAILEKVTLHDSKYHYPSRES